MRELELQPQSSTNSSGLDVALGGYDESQRPPVSPALESIKRKLSRSFGALDELMPLPPGKRLNSSSSFMISSPILLSLFFRAPESRFKFHIYLRYFRQHHRMEAVEDDAGCVHRKKPRFMSNSLDV